MFKNYGFCPCCEQVTQFSASGEWLRDQYLCDLCKCLPRERALMYCVDRFMPGWRQAAIHESSPSPRGASLRLQRDGRNYVASQYFADVPSGSTHQGWRCEDLEALSFGDASVDLHVTQDVMEHVLDPHAVFREIGRTLRPGGMHIFTVPLVNRDKPTQVCAVRAPDRTVEHLVAPTFHGSPLSNEGSLVTHNWGFDIVEAIWDAAGMSTRIVILDLLEMGIRAELIEVLVSVKRA